MILKALTKLEKEVSREPSPVAHPEQETKNEGHVSTGKESRRPNLNTPIASPEHQASMATPGRAFVYSLFQSSPMFDQSQPTAPTQSKPTHIFSSITTFINAMEKE
ncbi:hypothetical protein SESBI_12456 [Sesbania bispinosa]|nr:hypothetical protein SESBI_12456 [Sesbania bispinosa]